MALPRFVTGAAAQGLQWGANINQALGSQQAANSMRSQSSAIRDPNQVYQGNIVSELAGHKSSGAFVPVQNDTSATLGVATTQQPNRNETDPNSGNQYSGSYTGTGGGTNAYPAQDVSMYDQGISQANSALGRLDNQQGIGFENINSATNSALNRLLASKATAERDYNTTRTQTQQDNVSARSNIDAGVGRQANSLQRLLGARGAGNSSAARVAAPYAAALQGTQQRQQVQDAYGRNMQSLDTNFQDFNHDWTNSREDLDRQKFGQENALRSDIATKRSSLLSTLAQLSAQRAAAVGGSAAGAAQPYLDQINTLGGQIDNLGRQFANPINVQNPNYAAPELAQYNYDRAQAPQFGNGSAMTDTVNPYLSVLLNARRDQRQPQF